MLSKIYLTIVVAYFTLKVYYSRLKTSNNFIINLLWIVLVRAVTASLSHIIIFEEDDLPEHFVTSVILGRDWECFRIFKHNLLKSWKQHNSFYDKI